jgi:hypothetical protein
MRRRISKPCVRKGARRCTGSISSAAERISIPFAAFGYGLQPQLPFTWEAFEQLVVVVEGGFLPPGAGTQRAVSAPTEITKS